MKRSIFKAYDIRGRYPLEINGKNAAKIAATVAKHLKSGPLVLGYDTRLSSPELYKAILGALPEEKTIKIGMATTPMFYFLVNKLKAAGGIMITASHNPKDFNGLKVVRGKAAPISGQEILKWII